MHTAEVVRTTTLVDNIYVCIWIGEKALVRHLGMQT